MSVHLDVKQSSPEWQAARLGIPTASRFDQILTPKTLKPSSSSRGYLGELLAEWVLGQPLETGVTEFMSRGIALEEEAVSHYELSTDRDTRPAGLWYLDENRLVAASPDRLVGDEGLLEIKCPGPKEHLASLLPAEIAGSDFAAGHRAQCQGQLWVSGRRWVDLLSYSPAFPSVLVRVERDEEFIAALSAAVLEFVARLLAAREWLRSEHGVEPREPQVEKEEVRYAW